MRYKYVGTRSHRPRGTRAWDHLGPNLKNQLDRLRYRFAEKRPSKMTSQNSIMKLKMRGCFSGRLIVFR